MEIEDLKAIWKQYTEAEVTQKALPRKEITKMIKGKTHQALSLINRSILFEIGSLVLVTLFFSISAFFQLFLTQKILLTIIIVLCLTIGIFYAFKYRSINKIDFHSQDLKTSLEKLTDNINYFLKLYLRGSLILAPVTFLSCFLYGYSFQKDMNLLEEMGVEALSIAMILTCLSPLIIYPYTRWYLRRMYGRYLDDLKLCQKELEQ